MADVAQIDEARRKNREKAARWRERNPDYAQEYYQQNRERERTKKLEWHKRNPEKSWEIHRRNHLKRNFGITPQDYERMLADQGGVCAICKTQPKKRLLDVDHDHETDRIRGLLCIHCNTALGRVRDSIIVLRSMIDYLEKV
jgi:5-methylcytosine-specific restriction endonuclease McrA